MVSGLKVKKECKQLLKITNYNALFCMVSLLEQKCLFSRYFLHSKYILQVLRLFLKFFF